MTEFKKRKHKRIKGTFRVTAAPSSDLIIDWSCDSLDISEGGIKLVLSRQPIPGYDIEISFILPKPHQKITVQSKVIWTHPSTKTKGMFESGIEFQFLSAANKRLLHEYISKH